jgi:RNA-directed DNA polymerase
MSGDVHVRICERLGVKFPRATRLLCHCESEEQAKSLKGSLERRFAECGLELHPEKTRIVYCKDSNRRGEYPHVQFTFLGFTFRPRSAISSSGTRFTSFLPGVSREALTRMRRQIRSWHLARQTSGTLREFSQTYGSTLAGWWNYYSSF